jgi:hypothetical protein
MLRIRMTHCRAAAIALIGSAALSAPAFADDAGAKATLLPDASIVIHESNGKSTVIPINDQLAKRLLGDPQAKPLDANVIVFVANHQTYMVKDHQMTNGEMMVASILKDYVPVAGGG